MEKDLDQPDWDDSKDLFSLNTTDENGFMLGDQIVRTHGPDKCRGRFCVLHNPSDHHMRLWKTLYRADRGFTERICPAHGVGHPDPDDMAYHRSIGNDSIGIHGCCGCCQAPDPNGGLVE